jgi:predicted nuclease of predicted toxin-antitoxin system
VRFLLDQNQSPRIVGLLTEAGHDAIHVRDIDLGTSADEEVLAAAYEARRVIISADTDFGDLLAASNADGPSIVLLRRQGQRRAHEIAALILANLDDVADDLRSGAVVVLDDERIRIRSLPIRPD